jgi:hypothetical protein
MKTRKPRASKWAAYARPDGSFDFESLADAQKEEVFRDCQTLEAEDRAQPLSAAQRRLHARARRRGRPRKGRGARVISLSIEADLLRQAERIARARGISRSELFSRGLRAIIAAAG